MQLYVVYKNEGNIEVLDKYTIESVAIKGIEKYAYSYIESQVGKRNSINCIQYDRTIDDINSDSKLGEGFYLIKDDNMVRVVYKKRDIVHDKKQVISYVPTNITEVYPETVELVVIDKVLKKVAVPSSSYINYYMGYSEEIEKEVEEPVIKTFTLYSEREIVINKEEITYVYEKRKIFTSSIICDFGMIVLDLDDMYVNSSANVPAGIVDNEKVSVEKKKIKEIQSNYMSELVSLLQNGSILHTLKKVDPKP